MRGAIFCAVVVVLATEVLGDEKPRNPKQGEILEQRPIGLSGRRRSRPLGTPCQHSRDCADGCCLKSSDKRRCAAKAKTGEKCSDGQVKLDVFPNHCPCEGGFSLCTSPKYICEAAP